MPTLNIPHNIGDKVWVIDINNRSLHYGEIITINYKAQLLPNELINIISEFIISDDKNDRIVIADIEYVYDNKLDAQFELINYIESQSNC